MWAVPVCAKLPAQHFPAGLSISSEFLRSLKLNYPSEFHIAERGDVEFLASPKRLVGVDFRRIKEPLDTSEFAVEWRLKDVAMVRSIGVFQKSIFDKGIELDSRQSQSWSFTNYDFVPFNIGQGRLRFSLNLDPKSSSAQISLPSHPGIAPQTYSPVFAFTRTRMAQSMTPHKRFRTNKKKK
jgi:hypothetical protein